VLQHGAPKIRLDENHPLFGEGGRASQAEGNARLALAGDRTCHKHRFDRMNMREQRQAVVEYAKRLERNLHFSGRQRLAGQRGDGRKRRCLIELLEFLPRLDATIEQVEDERDPDAKQCAYYQRDQSRRLGLRRAGGSRNACRADNMCVAGLDRLKQQELLIKTTEVGAIDGIARGKFFGLASNELLALDELADVLGLAVDDILFGESIGDCRGKVWIAARGSDVDDVVVLRIAGAHVFE